VRPDCASLLALFEQLAPDAQARQATGWQTRRRLFGLG